MSDEILTHIKCKNSRNNTNQTSIDEPIKKQAGEKIATQLPNTQSLVS